MSAPGAPFGERALAGGVHVRFTERSDGNMSSVAGEGAEQGALCRERLRERLELSALVRGYQVHGSTVRLVLSAAQANGAPVSPDRPPQRPPDADGQATNLQGVGVMVLAADCLPVALAGDGAVAMLHAGWRGLAAGVLEEGARAVRELTGTERLLAVVGPGAGVCCYEVGEEVHAAFASSHRQGNRIDLRAIAHERLRAAGVSELHDVRACTICDERYFSHRREGATGGRHAGVAWLS